ncbi:quinol monooxygenase YgiN [Staphylococcus capitis]
MIIINAKIKVDENKREDYLQLMADLVEHSRQEKEIYSIITMKM